MPDIIDCNLTKNYQILINFGTRIPDMTSHHTVLIQKNIVYPPAMDTIEQLTVDVFVHCDFKRDNHVDFILSVCFQRVYLLKLLRNRGLQLPQLHTICQSFIVSGILYALPAWGGLLSAELKGRINAFLYGASTNMVLRTMLLTLNICWFQVQKKYAKVWTLSQSSTPPHKDNDIELRLAGHDFLLSICNYELHRRSVFIRCLF